MLAPAFGFTPLQSTPRRVVASNSRRAGASTVMMAEGKKKVVVLGGDGFCGWPTSLHLSDQVGALCFVVVVLLVWLVGLWVLHRLACMSVTCGVSVHISVTCQARYRRVCRQPQAHAHYPHKLTGITAMPVKTVSTTNTRTGPRGDHRGQPCPPQHRHRARMLIIDPYPIAGSSCADVERSVG